MRRVLVSIVIFMIFFSALAGSIQISTPQTTQAPAHISVQPITAITRNWTANIVVVNYNKSIIDESVLLNGLPLQRQYVSGEVAIIYNIDYNVYYADSEFSSDLEQVMMDNSVNGTGTGTELNETALLYQKSYPDEPQSIFYSRDGCVIDGYAVEDWLEANPFVAKSSLGYTLYLVNFSSLDTNNHTLEHWYNYHPIDPDTGQTQNWFRLEWDNDLNPNVTMDYPFFGGRYDLYVVDPSAHNWYLQWCRIWWSEENTQDYDFWTKDLEDKVAELDLGTPAGIDALNVYLRECIWDPITQLFFPYQHQPAKYVETGFLKALVFCMDIDEGVPVDSLTWVTNANMQLYHLQELYPFIKWKVDVQFLDINDYPDWNTTFWKYSVVEPDGTVAVDGGSMFDDIYSNMRPQYIDVNDNNINVFGVVFIKKQMTMYVYGRAYTGLGGGGQTVIWKSWERYYRPDGVTPKDGISAVQLHETMHAIGFQHTWQYDHYASDFCNSPMVYFAFHNGTGVFDKNWAQGTYLDQMEYKLWNNFTLIQSNISGDERSQTYLAEQKVLDYFNTARNQYSEMNWLGAYESLKEAKLWLNRLAWSLLDDTPPTISSWGGIPYVSTNGFELWVQAYDNLSGFENISAYVKVNATYVAIFPLVFDKDAWRAEIPAYESAEWLDVRIVVWDRAMNKAEASDVYPPVISDWGVSPEFLLNGFDVWVQVSDNHSGIQNVTVYVKVRDGSFIKFPCTQNGNFWNASVPQYWASKAYEVWIVVFDWKGNYVTTNLFPIDNGTTDHPVTLPSSTTATAGGLPYFYISLVAGISVMCIIIIFRLKKR